MELMWREASACLEVRSAVENTVYVNALFCWKIKEWEVIYISWNINTGTENGSISLR